MQRKVVLSKTAKKKLDALFVYLIEEWSLQVKDNLVKKIDRCIDIIKEQPEVFPESTVRKGLRKCVVTKQTILFYKTDSKTITIVTIFDTRSNPDKLFKDLENI